MHLAFHGGKCCGIKTIYGFSYNPQDHVDAIPEIAMDNRDQGDGDASSSTRFFHEEAPSEAALTRFDRYIEYVKRRRPKHIIEVVLNNFQKLWVDVLKERGFKKSVSAVNSNTGNTVTVWHLTVGQSEKRVHKKKVSEVSLRDLPSSEPQTLEEGV